MMNEEKEKQRFELKKLLIGGVITLLAGVIGTGIWKYMDTHRKEKLFQFILTINPNNGNTIKTFNLEIFDDMTGAAISEGKEYEVKQVVFQKNTVLKFILKGPADETELNGFYSSEQGLYQGIALGNQKLDQQAIESWEAILK